MPVNGSYHGISVCGDCLQNHVGVKFITTDGQGTSGILMLGESPWQDEVTRGKPFAGAAGLMLDSQLKRAGINRSNVIISNVMWCKPPWLEWVGKHPDSAIALRHCQPYWQKLVELTKPKVIVTLGAQAMGQVLECSGLDNRQAYVHDSIYGMPVIPTYHPAYILRGKQKLTQALFFAINRAVEVAKSEGGWHRERVTYLVDPPIEEARAYLFGGAAGYAERTAEAVRGASTSREGGNGGVGASQGLPQYQWVTRPPLLQPGVWWPTVPLLVCDIETPNSSKLDEEEREDKDPSYTIIRVSFSVAHGTALSMPWQEPYISLAKEALAASAVVVFWNGDGFDIPRLLFNGCSWRGEVHDGMWMWHFLQSDMLKTLGFVTPFFTDLPPWKHLSDTDPGYYSCCDADATFRNYVAIRRALEQAGRWGRFVRHCIRLDEILRRPSTGRININKEAQGLLNVRLEKEVADGLEQLQAMVPDSVKPKKVYKTSRNFDADDDKGKWHITQHPCTCTQPKAADGVPTDVEDVQL